MLSSRTGLPRRPSGLRWSVRAGLVVLGLVASTGCQVEYAGMTLPSGKYMQDDVQYFAPGPAFPYANTQAATQRAKMQAMGMAVPKPGDGLGTDASGMGTGTAAGGSGIPRPTSAPEAENAMPGGPSAPNQVGPGTNPGMGGAPGGTISPPTNP